MNDKIITPYFKLSEFKVSREYPRLAKCITFSKLDVRHIELLCYIHLQPLRYEFGGPIRILSGKRSSVLNIAIKGSKNSDHLFANAVDFTARDKKHLYQAYLEHLYKNYQSIGQSIIYLNKNKSFRFAHLSLPTEKHKRELLFSIEGDGIKKCN